MTSLYVYEAVTHTSHTVLIPLHQIVSLVEEINTVVVAGWNAKGEPLIYQLTEEDFQALKSHFKILRREAASSHEKVTEKEKNNSKNPYSGPPYAC